MRFLRDLMNKINERLKIFATLNSLFILNPQPRSLGLHHCELIKVSDENEYKQKKITYQTSVGHRWLNRLSTMSFTHQNSVIF